MLSISPPRFKSSEGPLDTGHADATPAGNKALRGVGGTNQGANRGSEQMYLFLLPLPSRLGEAAGKECSAYHCVMPHFSIIHRGDGLL
jgi:hypothetical protein